MTGCEKRKNNHKCRDIKSVFFLNEKSCQAGYSKALLQLFL